MNSKKSKQIWIFIILGISFLIEQPLRTTVISFLSFSQPLAYLITSLIFYIALFACFLVILKPNLTLKVITKTFCIVIAFFTLEQIISSLLFSEIFALVYKIVRPILIFFIIRLSYGWLLKTKFTFKKQIRVALGITFVVGALFNILEYIRIDALVQSMGNDFFSYLTLLTDSNSIYIVIAKLCTYIFTFILLVQDNQDV